MKPYCKVFLKGIRSNEPMLTKTVWLSTVTVMFSLFSFHELLVCIL